MWPWQNNFFLSLNNMNHRKISFLSLMVISTLFILFHREISFLSLKVISTFFILFHREISFLSLMVISTLFILFYTMTIWLWQISIYWKQVKF